MRQRADQIKAVLNNLRKEGKSDVRLMGALTQCDKVLDKDSSRPIEPEAIFTSITIAGLKKELSDLLDIEQNQVFPIVPYAASEEHALVVCSDSQLA
jgi:hypothetical protein